MIELFSILRLTPMAKFNICFLLNRLSSPSVVVISSNTLVVEIPYKKIGAAPEGESRLPYKNLNFNASTSSLLFL